MIRRLCTVATHRWGGRFQPTMPEPPPFTGAEPMARLRWERDCLAWVDWLIDASSTEGVKVGSPVTSAEAPLERRPSRVGGPARTGQGDRGRAAALSRGHRSGEQLHLPVLQGTEEAAP
jgi:hypothetical protein